MNRRRFVASAGGLAAMATANALRAEEQPIRLAMIGVGNRGRALLAHLKAEPSARIAALCDVNRDMLQRAQPLAGPGVAAVQDYRTILANPEIDAVVIAAPDHWHAIMAIEACKAGKDVYVEKPMSYTLEEGRRMIQAARKHSRVVQVGTQQLSGEIYKAAAARIKAGRLGKIFMIRTWNFRSRLPGYGFPPETDPPPTIDWDLWLGPRPKARYSELKAVQHWRSFWDYSGGMMADWGAHHFHSALEIMGYEPPLSVASVGGRYAINDAADVPDTQTSVFEFKDWSMEFMHLDASSQMEQGSIYGIEFRGAQGAMYLDRKGYRIFADRTHVQEEIKGEPGRDNILPPAMEQAHLRNFLACVRTREAPASDVEKAHAATTLCHLANIALKVGRRIRWDPAAETIPGDDDANAMLKATYRAPYLLPEA